MGDTRQNQEESANLDESEFEEEPTTSDDEPEEGLFAKPGRRVALGAFLSAAMGGAAYLLGDRRRPESGVTLRPPGALPEDEFRDACTRCFRCGSACPNGCIEFHGFTNGLKNAFTPYIKARSRGCILCGECTTVCPTGALQSFDVSREGWLESVDMGKARVNRDLCYSYHGRTCGACYQACPLAGQALTIGIFETPIMHPQHCVGCGLCEQACLHLPQAIRVIPTQRQPRAPGAAHTVMLAPELDDEGRLS